MPPALKALVAQIAGWIIAHALARSGVLPVGLWPLVGAQALAATVSALALRSARWWLPIHLAFTPTAVLASELDIEPGWYLAAFLVLMTIYWTSFRTQVPLFLTNRTTASAVASLLPQGRPIRLLDIGSGTGSLLLHLARRRPDSQFTGIEAAPAPYLIGRLLAYGQSNLTQHRGNFFEASWSDYDVIYAFLSPVPMAQVWTKALQEMHPGSILISNSFAVPGGTPEVIVPASRAGGRELLVYRPRPTSKAK
jgi:precorrin-6B methylase 2